MTIDSPLGTRWATTVAKLPRIIPVGTASMAVIGWWIPRRLPRMKGSRTSSADLPSGLRLPPGSEDRQQRSRVDLHPAIEAGVVVHDLKPIARERALTFDGNRQAEAIAARDREIQELKWDVDLRPPAVRPRGVRVGEVG